MFLLQLSLYCFTIVANSGKVENKLTGDDSLMFEEVSDIMLQNTNFNCLKKTIHHIKNIFNCMQLCFDEKFDKISAGHFCQAFSYNESHEYCHLCMGSVSGATGKQ